jgi:hypothetical protein
MKKPDIQKIFEGHLKDANYCFHLRVCIILKQSKLQDVMKEEEALESALEDWRSCRMKFLSANLTSVQEGKDIATTPIGLPSNLPIDHIKKLSGLVLLQQEVALCHGQLFLTS